MRSPPLPGVPGLFRCAKSGLIAELFTQAGLKNVTESEVSGKLKTGEIEVYWNFMTEVVAPVVAALSNADNTMKAKIKSEVFESIDQKFLDGDVAFDTNSLVIYGEKKE